MAFLSRKEKERKNYTNNTLVSNMCVCVLCETMIFVHILKCIPAQYRHDEDAEDALALGRRRVHGRDETAFIYAAVTAFVLLLR